MIEDYCSFETAMLLKEKGFDAEIKTYWWVSKVMGDPIFEFIPEPRNHDISNSEGYLSFNCRKTSLGDEVACIAPTLQMAMKWLREVHKLHISVDVSPIYGKVKNEKGRNTCGLLYWHYMASGEWMNDKYNPQQKAFVVSEKSYEKAVEAAIKYCLENLI